MHTEHLQNLKPSWVLFGWFVSVAVVSLIALVLAAMGMTDPDGASMGLWGVIAIGVGFFLGGLVTGARVGAAPILHGVSMGIVSLLVWFFANLAFGEALDAETWGEGTPAFYAGSLILQMAAATVGARFGSRQQRRATAGS
ncbi:hypothetical protein [Longimicrobium sp.]|uniref:hypothetical protein n=1 Tax=Longimicrobium sp. TaxID=2029185 RepID=UPI003B3B0BC4